MTCAGCGRAGPEPLPPDQFSRMPGYRCAGCGLVMRPPGAAGPVAVAALGGLFALGGVVMVVELGQDRRAWRVGGVLVVLGLVAAVWAVSQLRRPVPVGRAAPPASARGGGIKLFLAVTGVGVLLLGGALLWLMSSL